VIFNEYSVTKRTERKNMSDSRCMANYRQSLLQAYLGFSTSPPLLSWSRFDNNFAGLQVTLCDLCPSPTVQGETRELKKSTT
jgi:hypothetical protein